MEFAGLGVEISLISQRLLRLTIQKSLHDFHFSWWPLSVGDEIGRFIRHTGVGQVPEITMEASLRLVIFEPRLARTRAIMGTPADLLLARMIDEVADVTRLFRELGV
jgi:hypothetical protein